MNVKKTIKKLILSLVAVAVLVVSGGIYYVETTYLGIGLPWTTEVELPEFPDYPAPSTGLSEEQQGDIYYAGKSPYEMVDLITAQRAYESNSKAISATDEMLDIVNRLKR